MGTINSAFEPVVRLRPGGFQGFAWAQWKPLQRHSVDGESGHLYPSYLSEAHERILELAGREANWDGQGSAAIASSTVERADNTLLEIAFCAAQEDGSLPRPAVAVSPEGAIGFEWTVPNAYVVVECLVDSCMVYVRQGASEVEQQAASTDEIWALIGDVLAPASQTPV